LQEVALAITLDGLVRNATAGQKAGVPASTKADLATGAFDLASKSLGQQTDATNVQLSPFGQVKSSFVDVQSAGQTLSTPAKSSSVEDVTKSVQSFVDAFNNATRIVNSVGNSTNSLANSGQVNSASANLKSILANGSNTANLQNIGISVNQDGTLSVNTNTLQSAVQTNPNPVQDTLVKIGTQAVLASQNELGGNSGTVNPLSPRTRNFGARISGQQKTASNSQNANSQQGTSVSSNAAGGIAAYNQIFR
jgi:flagellar hook-associated protein 2